MFADADSGARDKGHLTMEQHPLDFSRASAVSAASISSLLPEKRRCPSPDSLQDYYNSLVSAAMKRNDANLPAYDEEKEKDLNQQGFWDDNREPGL